jgi:hypothetical protein
VAVYALQLGHCYRRSGATGTPGEQEYATAVGHEAARRLRALGHTVRVLLADDPVPRTDAFVAVHADGSTHASARGASVGYRTGRPTTAASRAAAHRWKTAYQRYGQQQFRADNYTPALSSYYGTGRAHAAGTPVAFIIEGGFLTNAAERAWLTSTRGRDACAQAIVDALTGATPAPSEQPRSWLDMATEQQVRDIVRAEVDRAVAAAQDAGREAHRAAAARDQHWVRAAAFERAAAAALDDLLARRDGATGVSGADVRALLAEAFKGAGDTLDDRG